MHITQFRQCVLALSRASVENRRNLVASDVKFSLRFAIHRVACLSWSRLRHEISFRSCSRIKFRSIRKKYVNLVHFFVAVLASLLLIVFFFLFIPVEFVVRSDVYISFFFFSFRVCLGLWRCCERDKSAWYPGLSFRKCGDMEETGDRLFFIFYLIFFHHFLSKFSIFQFFFSFYFCDYFTIISHCVYKSVHVWCLYTFLGTSTRFFLLRSTLLLSNIHFLGFFFTITL